MGAFAAGTEFFVPEHVELKRAPQLVRKPAGSVLTRMSESVFVELKLHGGQGDLRKTGSLLERGPIALAWPRAELGKQTWIVSTGLLVQH